MNCLWCDVELLLSVDWTTILLPRQPKKLCEVCEQKLKLITGNRCTRCSRYSKVKVCADCLWWANVNGGDDVIAFNYSIFSYNEHMKALIAKWKYRGDYELGYVFQDFLKAHFKVAFSSMKAVTVPIPLSEERLKERSFNQAVMLSSFLPLPQKNILSRVHGEKQSKKTRNERITTQNPFILQQAIKKPVILVDDIYTTGTTLRHAANVLREHGCPKVYTYTLIRG